MNSKEILTSLEEMLDTMKQEKDEKHDAFYCYYMCMKAGFLSARMDDSFSKEDVNEGWELWDYFMNTSLKSVYEYNNVLPRELSSDLVEHFCICKARLHVDLASFMEEEIASMRDIELDGIEGSSIFESYEDSEIDDEYKEALNILKGQVYIKILLQKYFTNKTGRKSLDSFISDILYYGSFYIALRETSVRTIQKTVVTRYDKFCLYQLIERYITFSEEFGTEYGFIFAGIFEYGMSQLRMDIYHRAVDEADIIKVVCMTLSLLVNKLQSSRSTQQDDYVFEYGAICLSPLSFTKNTCDLSYSLQEMKVTNSTESNRLSKGLYNILIHQKPMIIEVGFYGSYEGRFTVEEFRIWNLMYEEIEDFAFDEARVSLKKLDRHASFFRYIFHSKIIDIKELYEETLDLIEEEKLSEARNNYSQMQELVNDIHAYVVGAYPVNQLNDVLIKLYPLNMVLGKLNETLFHIPFDEDAFHKEIEGMIEKNIHKSLGEDAKQGRNNPCACGSGKKYKKCCLNT